MYEIFPSFIIMASRGSETFFTSLVTKTFDVCLLQTMQWPSSLTLLELLEWWASPTEVGRDKNRAMDVCEREIVWERDSVRVCVCFARHTSVIHIRRVSVADINTFFAVVPSHVISNFRRTLTTCFPVWTKVGWNFAKLYSTLNLRLSSCRRRVWRTRYSFIEFAANKLPAHACAPSPTTLLCPCCRKLRLFRENAALSSYECLILSSSRVNLRHLHFPDDDHAHAKALMSSFSPPQHFYPTPSSPKHPPSAFIRASLGFSSFLHPTYQFDVPLARGQCR